MQYVITQTKMDCGVRDLPMTQGVYECFHRILKVRRRPKVEAMIDNKIGFLFLDKNGIPKVAGHWQKYFNHMEGNIIARIQCSYRGLHHMCVGILIVPI